MSDLITFSSNVKVDDSETPESRFTSFSLDGANAETLVEIQNRLGSSKPVNMGFQGRNLLSRLAELEAIEALQVTNGGQPYALRNGKFVAVARAGELVTVTGTLADGTERSGTGIVTSVNANVGPQGALDQRVDLVFYPCNRLRFTSSSTVLTEP